MTSFGFLFSVTLSSLNITYLMSLYCIIQYKGKSTKGSVWSLPPSPSLSVLLPPSLPFPLHCTTVWLPPPAASFCKKEKKILLSTVSFMFLHQFFFRHRTYHQIFKASSYNAPLCWHRCRSQLFKHGVRHCLSWFIFSKCLISTFSFPVLIDFTSVNSINNNGTSLNDD